VDEWFQQLDAMAELIGDESITIEVHLMSDHKFNRLTQQQLEATT